MTDIRAALAFAKSMILSGEQMTPAAEEIFAKAFESLDAAPQQCEHVWYARPPKGDGTANAYCMKCGLEPNAAPQAGAWQDAERIRELPSVDAAIRNFIEDQTGDNAAGVIAAVLEAAAPQGEAEDCPSCANQGFWVQPNRLTGDAEQVQCEFCHTNPRSKFNAARQSRDAERWRAFVNCARIRFFGWAGYNNPNPYGDDPGNYRHFGAEFWTVHDAPTADKEQARKILEGFADAALAQEKEPS